MNSARVAGWQPSLTLSASPPVTTTIGFCVYLHQMSHFVTVGMLVTYLAITAAVGAVRACVRAAVVAAGSESPITVHTSMALLTALLWSVPPTNTA
jgi:hypothetical protein